MIPKSPWVLEAYPLQYAFIHGNRKEIISIKLESPVLEFQIEQDLEKDLIKVFLRVEKSYFQFEIFHDDESIVFSLKRGKEVYLEFQGKEILLQKGEALSFHAGRAFVYDHMERLSFGVSKKLNWELIKKRNDLNEILPILFFLGQKIEPSERELEIKGPETKKEFEHFLLSYFHHMLVPRRGSDRREGIFSELLPIHFKLEELIRIAYESIRKWLLREDLGKVFLLESLPNEFIHGRVLGLKANHAFFDIEWNKGKILKIKITGRHDGVLEIQWPKYVDSFRIKHHLKEKGRWVSRDEEILVSPSSIYYLDNFQK